MGRMASLALASLLTGCAGQVFTKYEHHSSIPDYRDSNTADVVGLPCVEVVLCPSCGELSPVMGGCVNWEVTKNPVFGRDPSGELYIKQPIKAWK